MQKKSSTQEFSFQDSIKNICKLIHNFFYSTRFKFVFIFRSKELSKIDNYLLKLFTFYLKKYLFLQTIGIVNINIRTRQLTIEIDHKEKNIFHVHNNFFPTNIRKIFKSLDSDFRISKEDLNVLINIIGKKSNDL